MNGAVTRDGLRRVAVGLVAMLAAACASTHGIKTTATVRDANTLRAEQTLADAPVSSAAWPQTAWWLVYADPQLDQR